MSKDDIFMHEARARLEEAVLNRARDDQSFRALLLSDPHAALRALLGHDPIPNMRIRVVEEASGEAVLVLPRQIESDELPDEVLDFAVGGNAKECWWKFNQWAYDQKWIP